MYEPSQPSDDALEAFRAQVTGRAEWAKTLVDTGLVVRPMTAAGHPPRPEDAIFDRITTLDLRTVWPLEDPGTASLWLTCLEPAPEHRTNT